MTIAMSPARLRPSSAARASTASTVSDVMLALEWTSHVALGVAIIGVVTVVVAASLRVAPIVAFVPSCAVFWQFAVPSEALGRMRARGMTSRDVAAAATRAVAGEKVLEYAFGEWVRETRVREEEAKVARVETVPMTTRTATRRGSTATTRRASRSRRRALPPADAWPHRPIFVRSSPRSETQVVTDGWASKNGPVFRATTPNARVKAMDASVAVNTETATSFETELFVGRVVCRFKGVRDHMTRTPASFYPEKGCTFQVLVQGRFKERVKVNDVLTGGEFDRPFENRPPKPLVYAGQQFFMSLTPGLSVDMLADVPYYYAPMGPTLSVLAAHAPEDAPEPTEIIEEDTRRLGGAFAERPRTAVERSRIFSDPAASDRYYFNTEDVYTFDYYQTVLLFNEYVMDIGITQLPLARCMAGQPISFFGKHKDGRYAYSFEIWHESLLPKAPERTPIGAPWPPRKRESTA